MQQLDDRLRLDEDVVAEQQPIVPTPLYQRLDRESPRGREEVDAQRGC
jgi:hypothetical protein